MSLFGPPPIPPSPPLFTEAKTAKALHAEAWERAFKAATAACLSSVERAEVRADFLANAPWKYAENDSGERE